MMFCIFENNVQNYRKNKKIKKKSKKTKQKEKLKNSGHKDSCDEYYFVMMSERKNGIK